MAVGMGSRLTAVAGRVANTGASTEVGIDSGTEAVSSLATSRN